jgi:hypothetical protein
MTTDPQPGARRTPAWAYSDFAHASVLLVVGTPWVLFVAT